MNRLINKQNESILMTLAFIAAPILYYRITKYFSSKKKRISARRRSSLSELAATNSKLKPPFPQEVRDLLSNCHLAYLSTVDSECSSSHLSLMRFTYLNDPDDGEVVIMSTSMQTKKFEMLQRQKGVALLVHDFGKGEDDGSGGQFSITLNGACRIVTNPKAEVYRKAHLKHNPDYPQFIVGQNIAILCVDVKSARICNIDDQVIKWNLTDENSGR